MQTFLVDENLPKTISFQGNCEILHVADLKRQMSDSEICTQPQPQFKHPIEHGCHGCFATLIKTDELLKDPRCRASGISSPCEIYL